MKHTDILYCLNVRHCRYNNNIIHQNILNSFVKGTISLYVVKKIQFLKTTPGYEVDIGALTQDIGAWLVVKSQKH